MKLLFISRSDNPRTWRAALAARMPDLEVRVWPDAGRAEAIDAALVWKPPPGALKALPNLKLIQSLGMGVDHIFADPELPREVPVARLIDPGIITQMAEYVCHAVLHFHRRFDAFAQYQAEQRWQPLPPPDTAACRVGVMGLGAIGSHTAGRLRALGFPVAGWSRSPKALEEVECFHGRDGLKPFLNATKVLVCLLPLTPETEDLIDAGSLEQLQEGGYLINCARGAHLVEADLLAALDQGRLAGATLDVFRQEPLPPEHPFWRHPRIRVTPHVAGLTDPRSAVHPVADNLRRLQAGKPLLNLVDRSRGY